VARKSSNADDTVEYGDSLDQLLHDFRSRNEYRAAPDYVIEPVDMNTTIPERFVKILRDSSLTFPELEETVEDTEVATEPNSGLILLAENYDKNARSKSLRSRIFALLSSVILIAAAITFSALAGNLWGGIVVVVVALVFLIMSRTAAAQAREIQEIASALSQPEETS
jgi:hypothetical protein